MQQSLEHTPTIATALSFSWRLSRTVLLAALVFLSGCESFSWGTDASGQLGDGAIGGGRNTPGVAASGFKWVELKAGWNHTCGVRDNNTLWCWGLNSIGQLGQGYEDVDSGVPLQVGTADDWSRVAAGAYHTCGIRAGGQLWCWGRGSSGELGDGLSTTSFVPVRVGTQNDWNEVSVGVRYTCGIRGQGDLYCWGRNGDGQLGLGDYTDRSEPTPLTGAPWKGVSAGAFHACALSAATELPYCWGDNTDNQINIQLTANYATPQNINIYKMYQVVAGLKNTCHIYKEGGAGNNLSRAVWCRGDPALLGATNSRFVGCTVEDCQNSPSLPRFRFVDVGPDAACGIVNGSNNLLCWGEGGTGAMGDGFSTDNLLPNAVLGNRKWWSVSVGSGHTVGLEVP